MYPLSTHKEATRVHINTVLFPTSWVFWATVITNLFNKCDTNSILPICKSHVLMALNDRKVPLHCKQNIVADGPFSGARIPRFKLNPPTYITFTSTNLYCVQKMKIKKSFILRL